MLLGEIISSYSTIESTAGNGIWLRPAGGADPTGLKIATTGAASFSSSVTAGGQTSVLYSGYDSGAEGLRLGFDTSYYNAITGTFSSTAANNKMAFVVNSGNGTRGTVMTLLGSGNVGIGTSSPSTYVDGSSGLAVAGSARGSIAIVGTSTTADESLGRLSFTNTNTTNTASRLVIIDGVRGADNNSGYLTFSTANSGNPTERMRITSGGQIVMGRTSPSGSGRLTVDGDLYLHNITLGAGQSTLKYNYTSTGQVTYDTSSRLLKKDIEDLSYGLQDILKMSAKKYKWKKDSSTDLGFIADEMFKVIPEIVFFSNENTEEATGIPSGEPLSINYDRLIPVLVNAIKELKAEIDTLKK
ncbi:MAG: tail fiber domain-containing protein [Cytophagia bacterium]|nr:tail fiber domain-containing protein [Cytophagia bacterium]